MNSLISLTAQEQFRLWLGVYILRIKVLFSEKSGAMALRPPFCAAHDLAVGLISKVGKK